VPIALCVQCCLLWNEGSTCIVKNVQVEGKGNGIKTVIANMAEIAKALSRPPTCMSVISMLYNLFCIKICCDIIDEINDLLFCSFCLPLLMKLLWECHCLVIM